jgi:hypothetical protein
MNFFFLVIISFTLVNFNEGQTMLCFFDIVIYLNSFKHNLSCPNIISRAAWGARSSSGTISNFYQLQFLTRIKISNNFQFYKLHIFMHHGASAACTTQASCTNMVKSFQNLHMVLSAFSIYFILSLPLNFRTLMV